MIDIPRGGAVSAPLSAAAPGARIAKVFVTDSASEGIIRRALGDLGIDDAADFTRGTVETATAALSTQTSPQLLFIDITGVEEPIGRMNELAEKCEPDIKVVVIGDRNDIPLYRDLRNAGVTEYFYKPLVLDLIKNVCNEALSGDVRKQLGGNPRIGKLVFTLGVRGGVGATTIAANLAWRLAEVRQRWVMLVDLDLQNGDAALQLDAEPSHALCEALENPERVDKLFLERGKIHATPRLALLASLEPLGTPVPLNEDAILSLFEKLLHRYRFVIVDVPAAAAIRLMRILHQPSTCVLVSNPTLAAARDLARWLEFLGPNSLERRTMHILNMAGAPGALPPEEFLRAVGQTPDITIPYDREIAAASNLGVKATQKCASFNRGLGLLLRDVAGEPMEAETSILSRMIKRFLRA